MPAIEGNLQIEYVSPDILRPFDGNPRTISESGLEKLQRSVEEFGFVNPILAQKGTRMVIAGHQRLKAAKAAGLTEVPVVWLDVDDVTAKAYNIADNRTAEESEWDFGPLADLLAELDNGAFDLSLTGFDEDEIERMMNWTPDGDGGSVEEDEIPDPPKEAITKPGDLWLLGRHRLLCGDSTSAEDVGVLMAGVRAHLCFTSPPYAQQRDYTAEAKEKVSDWDGLMIGVFENIPMADDGQVLVNLGLVHKDGEWWPYWDGWIEWMRARGWRRFGWYVWDQMHGLRGDWAGRCAPSHEFIFHFNKKAKKPNKWLESKHAGEKGGALRRADGTVGKATTDEIQPFKIPDSVWRVQRQKGGIEGHPAPFSVGLAEYALRSWPGDVYDPFLGSGTTLIAAEQLGRTCFGMEISPQYCDVIIERWQNLTGNKAKLQK